MTFADWLPGCFYGYHYEGIFFDWQMTLDSAYLSLMGHPIHCCHKILINNHLFLQEKKIKISGYILKQTEILHMYSQKKLLLKTVSNSKALPANLWIPPNLINIRKTVRNKKNINITLTIQWASRYNSPLHQDIESCICHLLLAFLCIVFPCTLQYCSFHSWRYNIIP